MKVLVIKLLNYNGRGKDVLAMSDIEHHKDSDFRVKLGEATYKSGKISVPNMMPIAKGILTYLHKDYYVFKDNSLKAV